MNPAEQSQQAFETSDLNLASFLRCRSLRVQSMKQRDGKTVFVFADSEELRRTIVDFVNDGSIPVRSFCNTLRDFKALTR
jgi:hypothetical protein